MLKRGLLEAVSARFEFWRARALWTFPARSSMPKPLSAPALAGFFSGFAFFRPPAISLGGRADNGPAPVFRVPLEPAHEKTDAPIFR